MKTRMDRMTLGKPAEAKTEGKDKAKAKKP